MGTCITHWLVTENLLNYQCVYKDRKTWKRLIGHYEHENYIFLWNVPMLFNVMLVVLLFVAEYPLQFTYWESIQTVILTAIFATIFLVAIFPRNYLTSSWIDERLGCKGLRFSSLQCWLIIIMNQIGLPREQPPCTRTERVLNPNHCIQLFLHLVCLLINMRISWPITFWQLYGNKTDEECTKKNSKNRNYFATLFNVSWMLMNLITLMMVIAFLGPYIVEQYQDINWLVKYDLEMIAVLGLKFFLVGTPFVYYLFWFPCMICQIMKDHKHY